MSAASLPSAEKDAWRSVEVHELRDDLARAIHEQHFAGGPMPSCGFPARPGLCMEAGARADAVLNDWPDSILSSVTPPEGTAS